MKLRWVVLTLLAAGVVVVLAMRPASRGVAAAPPTEGLAKATFAGGCFWCMEAAFDEVPGVVSTTSGFAGGKERKPTYEQVSAGGTGHAESVQVVFDPKRLSYEALLDAYWRNVDPLDGGGQFCDRGRQYRTVIFYHDETQRQLAEASRKRLAESGRFKKPIVTAIEPVGEFWPAEDYHQDFHTKNPVRYKTYRLGCGRDRRLRELWGSAAKASEASQKGWKAVSQSGYKKPAADDLRKQLTPLQYKVTQDEATEPPFRNEYWDNHEPGIYVDVVSGEPLFSSLDKFDSGTGWPSFSRPLEPKNVSTRTDLKLLQERDEVRSKHANSHLGHVFDDGPKPTGLRYCLNSAALRFIPLARLEAEGYGEYLPLFEKAGQASK